MKTPYFTSLAEVLKSEVRTLKTFRVIFRDYYTKFLSISL